MRWLFLLLLFFNLAYIGWQVSRSSSDNYADVPVLKNVQTIVLLSELTPLALPDKAVPVENKPDAVDTALAENLYAKPTGVEQSDAKPQVSKPQASVEKKPEAEPGSEPEVKVSAAVPEVVKKPKLVAVVEVQPEALSANTSQVASCFTLGPFKDLDKLRALTREIKSYVLEADFRGREEKEPTLYWVYIKPEKNHARAIKTGKRLKAKKIKDFYVIRDGEKINGLSLGYFRNKKGAYGLTKKVRKLGFDVIVEPVFRTYTIYWLDYRLDSGVIIPESIFEKYTGAAKEGKISRLGRDCAI